MTPMTCWPALLTGLYRELFTESGPFFSCVYFEFKINSFGALSFLYISTNVKLTSQLKVLVTDSNSSSNMSLN